MRIPLLAAAAALFWSVPAYAEDRPTTTTNQLTDVASLVDSPERQVLSQGDPGWKWIQLGRGGPTVVKAGCLVMALMDVMVQMGLVIASPVTFIARLSQASLFTKEGDLRWDLDKVFPVVTKRLSLAGTAAYNEAVRQLKSGASVLLQVKTRRGTKHWVVASKVVGNDMETRDPNGGKVALLGSSYGIHSLLGLAVITLAQ